jgi:hypothetical protein
MTRTGSRCLRARPMRSSTSSKARSGICQEHCETAGRDVAAPPGQPRASTKPALEAAGRRGGGVDLRSVIPGREVDAARAGGKNGIRRPMKRARRTALVGLVWLTAAAVAFASTPRVVCACAGQRPVGACGCCKHCHHASPRGPAKPPTARTGGCCCRAKPGSRPAPGRTAHTAPAKADPSQAGLTSPGCAKALAQHEALAAQAAGAPVVKDLSPGPILFAANALSCVAGDSGPATTVGAEVCEPPPTDLLTVCCRLLI